MTESVNSGDYRACPFCSELIRKRAIKCKHCASEIDPRRVREYGSTGRNNPWHLIVLGFLLLMTVFIVAYPSLVEHMEERALAKAMIQKATAIPEAPPRTEAPKIVLETDGAVSGLRRLNFGEDSELVVGKTYSGSTLTDLLEANTASRYRPESRITVDFAGMTYEIRTRQPRFSPDVRYEILSIEENW